MGFRPLFCWIAFMWADAGIEFLEVNWVGRRYSLFYGRFAPAFTLSFSFENTLVFLGAGYTVREKRMVFPLLIV